MKVKPSQLPKNWKEKMGSFKTLLLGPAVILGASLLPTTRATQEAKADPPAKVATLEGSKKAHLKDHIKLFLDSM